LSQIREFGPSLHTFLYPSQELTPGRGASTGSAHPLRSPAVAHCFHICTLSVFRFKNSRLVAVLPQAQETRQGNKERPDERGAACADVRDCDAHIRAEN
jgi:hypothetical protein